MVCDKIFPTVWHNVWLSIIFVYIQHCNNNYLKIEKKIKIFLCVLDKLFLY